jgi:hypothetical protein
MTRLVDIPLAAYPNLTEAADIVGVSPSTLSRRDDIETLPMGSRDHRLPPEEVLRLVRFYGRRSINEAAAELIEYAQANSPSSADQVEAAVEAFFEQLESPKPSGSTFLAQAKASLPAALYREVEKAYRASEGKPTPGMVSAD